MCYSYPIINASRRAVRPTTVMTFCLVWARKAGPLGRRHPPYPEVPQKILKKKYLLFVYPMTNDNSEMTSLTIIQYLPWYIFYWSSGISLSWKGYRSSITEYKAYSVQNENVLKDIVTSYHSRPTAVHNEHPRTQTHCLDITGQNNWVRTVICKTIFSRWSCSCQAMGWAPHDKDTLPQ